jgi:hypothetical protein
VPFALQVAMRRKGFPRHRILPKALA